LNFGFHTRLINNISVFKVVAPAAAMSIVSAENAVPDGLLNPVVSPEGRALVTSNYFPNVAGGVTPNGEANGGLIGNYNHGRYNQHPGTTYFGAGFGPSGAGGITASGIVHGNTMHVSNTMHASDMSNMNDMSNMHGNNVMPVQNSQGIPPFHGGNELGQNGSGSGFGNAFGASNDSNPNARYDFEETIGGIDVPAATIGGINVPAGNIQGGAISGGAASGGAVSGGVPNSAVTSGPGGIQNSGTGPGGISGLFQNTGSTQPNELGGGGGSQLLGGVGGGGEVEAGNGMGSGTTGGQGNGQTNGQNVPNSNRQNPNPQYNGNSSQNAPTNYNGNSSTSNYNGGGQNTQNDTVQNNAVPSSGSNPQRGSPTWGSHQNILNNNQRNNQNNNQNNNQIPRQNNTQIPQKHNTAKNLLKSANGQNKNQAQNQENQEESKHEESKHQEGENDNRNDNQMMFFDQRGTTMPTAAPSTAPINAPTTFSPMTNSFVGQNAQQNPGMPNPFVNTQQSLPSLDSSQVGEDHVLT
jgi:hypothetical protein